MPGVTFEIRRAVETESRLGNRVFAGCEQFADFVALPDVVASFLAFGIRVERTPESAVPRLHLARDPAGARARGTAKRRFVEHDARVRVEWQQLCVVVQHLLEVRN